MNPTITRTYDRYVDARGAVHAVKEVGVLDEDISVVANSDHPDADAVDDIKGETSTAGAGAGVGATLGGGAGLLAGLGLMAVPGVGPIVAAGWLASTAAGAVAGAITGAAAGGIVDALTDDGVPETEAQAYAEAVRRGGILLSVKTTPENEADVIAALDNNRPIDLALRRGDWERDGWKDYDPASPAYSPDEAMNERNRYL
jgi:hypothetical protein